MWHMKLNVVNFFYKKKTHNAPFTNLTSRIPGAVLKSIKPIIDNQHQRKIDNIVVFDEKLSMKAEKLLVWFLSIADQCNWYSSFGIDCLLLINLSLKLSFVLLYTDKTNDKICL